MSMIKSTNLVVALIFSASTLAAGSVLYVDDDAAMACSMNLGRSRIAIGAARAVT